jgi:hypothetical protein
MIVGGIGAIALIGGVAFLFFHYRKPVLEVRTRSVEARLTEIDLVNVGKTDGRADVAIDVTWDGGTLADAAGLAGYGKGVAGDKGITFSVSGSGPLMHAGESLAVGWVRLSDDSAVHAVIEPAR